MKTDIKSNDAFDIYAKAIIEQPNSDSIFSEVKQAISC